MKRRDFLRASVALAAGAVGASGAVRAQTGAARFCDMHAHLGFRQASYRAALASGDMLLVAEKVTPDSPIVRLVGNRLASIREAAPGELRKNFEDGLKRRRQKIRDEGMIEVTSVDGLARVLADQTPAIAISAEGADFLEGDVAYLEQARAQGLVHLQIVHYYTQSLIGDISTQPPHHDGLSAHGKDLVRACNRLKILVDVAHCSNVAMEHGLWLRLSIAGRRLRLLWQPLSRQHGLGTMNYGTACCNCARDAMRATVAPVCGLGSL